MDHRRIINGLPHIAAGERASGRARRHAVVLPRRDGDPLIAADVDVDPQVIGLEELDGEPVGTCTLCGAHVPESKIGMHADYHDAIAELVRAQVRELDDVRAAVTDALTTPAPAVDPAARLAAEILATHDASEDAHRAGMVPDGSALVIISAPRGRGDALARALDQLAHVEQYGPIVREATPPLVETIAYAVDVDALVAALELAYHAQGVAPGGAGHFIATVFAAEASPGDNPPFETGPRPDTTGRVRVTIEGDRGDLVDVMALLAAKHVHLDDLSGPRTVTTAAPGPRTINMAPAGGRPGDGVEVQRVHGSLDIAEWRAYAQRRAEQEGAEQEGAEQEGAE